MDALRIMPVSKAQARQRAGRAGREAAGLCYRLFTEASFKDLEVFNGRKKERERHHSKN